MSRRGAVILAAFAFSAPAAAPSAAVNEASSSPVAETVWLPPALVSPDGNSADMPTLVVDPAGNTTVTWIGVDAGEYAGLFLARRPAGGEWSEPVLADPDADDLAKVSAAPSGQVTALYTSWRGRNRLRSVTIARDGTLEAPVRLTAAGTGTPSHDLAVDAAGTMTAVWVQRLWGTYSRVMVSRRVEGKAWSTPRFLSGPRYAAHWVEVDAAPSGEVTVGWSARSKVAPRTGVRTWSRTLVPGSGWSPPVPLSMAGRDSLDLTVLAGVGGRAWVAWTLEDYARRTTSPLLLSFRRVSGSWTKPVAMTSGPDAVTDVGLWRGPGSVALTWTRQAGPRNWRLFVRIRHGGTWSTPRRVSRLRGDVWWPQAGYAPDGRLTLMWLYRPEASSNRAMQARTRRSDGTWEDIVRLSPFSVGYDLGYPSIGVGSTGVFHAAWMSRWRVWVADQVPPTATALDLARR